MGDKYAVDEAVLNDLDALSRIATVAGFWSHYEARIERLLLSMLCADNRRMRAVLYFVSARNQEHAIGVILKDRDGKDAPSVKAFRELSKESDKCRRMRNRIVHGVWEEVETQPHTPVFHTTWGDAHETLEVVRQSYDRTALEKLGTRIDALYKSLLNFEKEFLSCK